MHSLLPPHATLRPIIEKNVLLAHKDAMNAQTTEFALPVKLP